eukprot:9469699-Pyramimonas_sp.AAC.1
MGTGDSDAFLWWERVRRSPGIPVTCEALRGAVCCVVAGRANESEGSGSWVFHFLLCGRFHPIHPDGPQLLVFPHTAEPPPPTNVRPELVSHELIPPWHPCPSGCARALVWASVRMQVAEAACARTGDTSDNCKLVACEESREGTCSGDGPRAVHIRGWRRGHTCRHSSRRTAWEWFGREVSRPGQELGTLRVTLGFTLACKSYVVGKKILAQPSKGRPWGMTSFHLPSQSKSGLLYSKVCYELRANQRHAINDFAGETGILLAVASSS